jgi:hypothetical protein
MSELTVIEALRITIEKLKEYVDRSSSKVEVDTTLSMQGKAADSKAVGDALANKQPAGNYALKSEISNLVDETVPAWAKAATKPTYTASEVGALPADTVIPSMDGYATEQYVDDIMDSMPITMSEDGYIDLQNIRQATSCRVIKNGNEITILTTLEGNSISTTEITTDDNGYPMQILADGSECDISWEGFSAVDNSVWEGGIY